MISGDNLVNIMSPVLNKMKEEYDEKGSDIPNITYEEWKKLSQKEKDENTYIVKGYPTGGGGGGSTPIDSEINYAFLHFDQINNTDRRPQSQTSPIVFDLCESNNIEIENNAYVKLNKDKVYLINVNSQNANYHQYLTIHSVIDDKIKRIAINGSDSGYHATSLCGIIYKCTQDNEKLCIITDNGYGSDAGFYRTSMTSFSVLELAAFNYTSSSPSLKKYSTEEQVIGTWIDEKTIYEKIIPCNDTYNVPINVSDLNIDYVIKLTGVMINDGKDQYSIPYADKGYYTSIYYDSVNNTVNINRSSSTSMIRYVLIQYTKKGDIING